MSPYEHRLLSEMEGHVRDFHVIYLGEGHVQGGFGHLPQSDDVDERIANLHRSMDKFHLSGDGVELSGSFDKGFIIQ